MSEADLAASYGGLVEAAIRDFELDPMYATLIAKAAVAQKRNKEAAIQRKKR